MSLDTDQILDRRKLKRSRAVWRVFAVLAVAVLVIVLVGRFDGLDGQAHIAALEVAGIIVDDQDRLELLHKIADDSDVKALIVNINSPGPGLLMFLSLIHI